MNITFLNKWIAVFVLFSLLLNTNYAQGLRNEQYSYDFKDLEYIFKSQNITSFKFTFKSEENTSLNIIVRYFRNGELVNEYNLLKEGGIKLFKMMDDPRTNFFPKQNLETPPMYRFYVHTPIEKDAFIDFSTGGLNSSVQLENSQVKLMNSMALYEENEPITSLTPILLVYGWNEFYISCPSDVYSERAIIDEYEVAAIIYVEPFNVDSVNVNE